MWSHELLDDARKNMTTKRTKKQVIEAIKASRGIKTQISKRLKINRMTLDRYLKRWPEAQEAYTEECETLLDLAEARLFEKAINDGSECSLHFLLSTKGKHRGYTRKVEGEHTHKGVRFVVEVGKGE